MLDVLTFCKLSIETASLEITETQKELVTKFKNEEHDEINTTVTWKHLRQKKR